MSDIQTHVDSVRRVVGAEADAANLPSLLCGLDDDGVVALIEEASAIIRSFESLRVAASGVVAVRSSRDAGHSGLAQIHGHRSPAAFVQKITGSTRTDAAKHVRLGTALLADVGGGGNTDPEPGGSEQKRVPAWHAPLGEALLAGRLTTAQHDVILRGLGEPPAVTAGTGAASAADAGGESDTTVEADTDALKAGPGLITAADEQTRRAWASAAVQLIGEAQCRTVEELGHQARAIRDMLDAEGADRRFRARFERRSFRTWVDPDGVRHGSILFDDDGALWTATIMDGALAPRRGVRFVDPDQRTRADELAADPRTTEQLAYVLLIDILRSGALANASDVFGTRQAGVRVVIGHDAMGAAQSGEPAVGVAEDDGGALPGWLVAQHACDTGVRTCSLDRDGNPLELGRSVRLFTPAQKLALTIRDGGCRWPGCDRPAHYCEAHHIDEWAGGGRTDVERGILLCRFHHMHLHHGRWRIRRDGTGDFVLHPPGRGTPAILTTRLARRYLWRYTPPRRRFRPAT